MKETFHAEAWLHHSPAVGATPMLRIDDKDFFTGEILQLVDGTHFIPVRFFERQEHGIMSKWAYGHGVQESDVRSASVS